MLVSSREENNEKCCDCLAGITENQYFFQADFLVKVTGRDRCIRRPSTLIHPIVVAKYCFLFYAFTYLT